MKKNIKVSIVTATFNLVSSGRISFFRQNIESVHKQTYKNLEHIIVDGGSTDGTVEILENYFKKGWIKYISKKDNGIYDAMNKGIHLATGKYIAFLNSDDFYHNNKGVETTVIALETSGADFSYAPAKMVQSNGEDIGNIHPHVNPIIENVFFVMPFCHQTMFTKKSVLLDEHCYDTYYKSAGDYDLVVRLCLKDYKCIKVLSKFTTFRLGGLSDNNQLQSINEVATLYYKNYSKFSKINAEDCHKIYCRDFEGITPELAWHLKEHKQYFDFEKYYNYLVFKIQKLSDENNSLANRIVLKLLPYNSIQRKLLSRLVKIVKK